MICLSVCLSIDLSHFLSVYLSVCLLTYPSIHPSRYLSIYPSIHPSRYLSIYLSIHLDIYLSFYLCNQLVFLRLLLIYLSIYISISMHEERKMGIFRKQCIMKILNKNMTKHNYFTALYSYHIITFHFLHNVPNIFHQQYESWYRFSKRFNKRINQCSTNKQHHVCCTQTPQRKTPADLSSLTVTIILCIEPPIALFSPWFMQSESVEIVHSLVCN